MVYFMWGQYLHECFIELNWRSNCDPERTMYDIHVNECITSTRIGCIIAIFIRCKSKFRIRCFGSMMVLILIELNKEAWVFCAGSDV